MPIGQRQTPLVFDIHQTDKGRHLLRGNGVKELLEAVDALALDVTRAWLEPMPRWPQADVREATVAQGMQMLSHTDRIVVFPPGLGGGVWNDERSMGWTM